jgi:NAD(P)-dependent dehydrogenase (short-subunit alcohol dehydrogenase family)
MYQKSFQMNFQISHLFDVKEKVALITGGATGIGKMLAYALSSNGARVYITSRKLDMLKETTEEINRFNQCENVFYVQSDLTTRKECEELAKIVTVRESKLDILIHCAGISWGGVMEDFNEEMGWDRLFALNVKSIFYLTVALTPLLQKASRGNSDPSKVITISSIAADTPRVQGPLSKVGTGTWSYNASKAAVNQLTKSLALSLSTKSITCNAIAPGFFPSRMTEFGLKENLDVLESLQPLGRIGGATDMAALGLFLCSKGSAHINGAIIPIDGGQSLARL